MNKQPQYSSKTQAASIANKTATVQTTFKYHELCLTAKVRALEEINDLISYGSSPDAQSFDRLNIFCDYFGVADYRLDESGISNFSSNQDFTKFTDLNLQGAEETIGTGCGWNWGTAGNLFKNMYQRMCGNGGNALEAFAHIVALEAANINDGLIFEGYNYESTRETSEFFKSGQLDNSQYGIHSKEE